MFCLVVCFIKSINLVLFHLKGVNSVSVDLDQVCTNNNVGNVDVFL